MTDVRKVAAAAEAIAFAGKSVAQALALSPTDLAGAHLRALAEHLVEAVPEERLAVAVAETAHDLPGIVTETLKTKSGHPEAIQ